MATHQKLRQKECPKCKAMIPFALTVCPECTHHFNLEEDEQQYKMTAKRKRQLDEVVFVFVSILIVGMLFAVMFIPRILKPFPLNKAGGSASKEETAENTPSDDDPRFHSGARYVDRDPPPDPYYQSPSTYQPSTAVPSPPVSAEADRQEFYNQLLRLPDADTFIYQSGRGSGEDDLRIAVHDAYFYQPYQMRLQFAQNLWRLWAAIHSPSIPDKSKITLVDRNGNHIGGSSSLAGSIVRVDR